jgi:DNA-binding MarR family transcriptional regulator
LLCDDNLSVFGLLSQSGQLATVDLSATKNCHCLAARRHAREITRLYNEKLRIHGLQSTQLSVLAALALKGPTPLGELANLLGLERTTLTRSANRLEDEGWVTDAEANDARKRCLNLTPDGRKKVESAYPAWKETQDEVDEQMDGLATE